MTTRLMSRRAGIAATIAGSVGLVSVGLLVAAIVTRAAGSKEASTAESGALQEGPWTALFRGHDAAVALQSLLMMFVIWLIWDATNRASAGWGRVTATVGAIGHAGIVLSVALVFAYRASWADMLYMFPQGFVGIWLIALSWSTPQLSMPFRATAAVAGVGLVLLAGAAAMIANALGWHIFDLTRVPSVEAANLSAPGNRIGHVLLPIGTLLGRALYPAWSIVLGWKLISDGGFDAGGASSTVPRGTPSLSSSRMRPG